VENRGSSCRIGYSVVLGLLIVLLAVPVLRAQEHPIPSYEVELAIDSGMLINNDTESQVVWSTVVEVPEAIWLRLKFGNVVLANDPEILESSVIRITSLYDSAVQHLNSLTLGQWQNTSAYFNGDVLLVELIALPGVLENRVVISGATAGLPSGPIESICGPTDDRVLSYSLRDARAMPIGCSAWIIDDSHHQFITAGHCASGSQVMEFNVPLSQSNGNIVHPGPEDQYSADSASRQYENGGMGDDWGYFGCFPNTETGLTAFQAGGEYYTLSDAAPPVEDQTIRITGYGTTSNPVPREWNQVQKIHEGPYYGLSGTRVRYTVDTTGGNSGSPVFNEDTGEAIGVHTHGGCDYSGGYNTGTAIHNSAFTNALLNPIGICAPIGLTVTNLAGGQIARVTVHGATPGERVFFGFSLTGVGEVPVNYLGVIIGIADPVFAGSAIADNSGEAFVEHWINPNQTGRQLWIQAAQKGLTSIVLEEVIQ